MGSDETHSLGYEQVDGDPNLDVLLDTMDATSTWPAVRQMRTWEREQLGLTAGQRLLDVGCGQGDAALALGQDLGPEGEVVGIDASLEMVRAARQRASAAPCSTRFATGDAMALEEGDRSFHAVRSERCLQWLSDPMPAVREMERVVRPGGRVSLLDTDWSTFSLDVGDERIAAIVRGGMRVDRRRAWNVGSRLTELVTEARLDLLDDTTVTQIWDAWDPDRSPVPLGCFSMTSLAADLIEAGQLPANELQSFVSTVESSARAGQFSMSLTMSGVVAVRPRRR